MFSRKTIALLVAALASPVVIGSFDLPPDVLQRSKDILVEERRQLDVGMQLNEVARDFRRLIVDLEANGLLKSNQVEELKKNIGTLEAVGNGHVKKARDHLREARKKLDDPKHIKNANQEIGQALAKLQSLVTLAKSLERDDELRKNLDVILKEQGKVLQDATELAKGIAAEKIKDPDPKLKELAETERALAAKLREIKEKLTPPGENAKEKGKETAKGKDDSKDDFKQKDPPKTGGPEDKLEDAARGFEDKDSVLEGVQRAKEAFKEIEELRAKLEKKEPGPIELAKNIPPQKRDPEEIKAPPAKEGDPSPPKDGPSKDSPPKDGPPKDGPPKDGPPKDGPPKDGPPKDGPPKDGPPKDGPPKDGPPKDGPPKDGPPKDGPPKDGPPKDGPPKDGPPKDGPPKDGKAPGKDGKAPDGKDGKDGEGEEGGDKGGKGKKGKDGDGKDGEEGKGKGKGEAKKGEGEGEGKAEPQDGEGEGKAQGQDGKSGGEVTEKTKGIDPKDGLRQFVKTAPKGGDYVRDGSRWNPLDDRERAPVVERYLRELPIEYREMMREYYRALTK